MTLTYKRKLILNKEQENKINMWIGTCRLVYNLGLEVRISAWKNKQHSVHKYELMKQITQLRSEYEWISDVPATSLQNTIERLEHSYKMFFKGRGFPKWASSKYYKSILFKQDKNLIRVCDNKVNIPKLGFLKIFKDCPVKGKIKFAVIKKEINGYFITICADATKDIQNKNENQVIGLDMGVIKFYTDSNGHSVDNPRHFKIYERKLRIENRSLARKKKGSNSWAKQTKRVALLHNKIGNVRKDFLHKESTNLAKKYNAVYLEDLNISGMVKGNLSKHILDCGWGAFRTMLSYKTTLVAVNPKFTSQTCNDCGAKDAKSRISQSKFVCTSCGTESNADENAAKNILGKGIALTRQREAIACA